MRYGARENLNGRFLPIFFFFREEKKVIFVNIIMYTTEVEIYKDRTNLLHMDMHVFL